MMEGIMTKESTIHITEVDLARLRKLIETARNSGIDSNTPYMNKLEGELDRANIVDPKESRDGCHYDAI